MINYKPALDLVITYTAEKTKKIFLMKRVSHSESMNSGPILTKRTESVKKSFHWANHHENLYQMQWIKEEIVDLAMTMYGTENIKIPQERCVRTSSILWIIIIQMNKEPALDLVTTKRMEGQKIFFLMKDSHACLGLEIFSRYNEFPTFLDHVMPCRAETT